MGGADSLLRRIISGVWPAGRHTGRFWFESVFALVSVIVSVATLIVPTWIEAVFNGDPDQHNGALEWAIAAVLLAAAVAAVALARREPRRRLTVAPVMSRQR